MKIIRAEHLGMCFGVRDAIALALETAKLAPLTILGDLVHNETVLAELRARGIGIEQSTAVVPTRTVMVTAHGVSERKLNETRGHGLTVLRCNAESTLLKVGLRDACSPTSIQKPTGICPKFSGLPRMTQEC